jgi:5-methylcytosine-specific restriction protein B
MKNDINILYRYIMSKHQSGGQGWYEAYKNFIQQMKVIQQKLRGLELDLNSTDLYTEFDNVSSKYEFLRKLIYEQSNGIASRGQSTLSEDDLNKIKDDKEFLDSLRKLIKDADSSSLENFSKIWNAKIGTNNKVLYNRIAAACNDKLSTTVNEPDFMDAYQWLKSNGYVDDTVSGVNWFEKNISLIEFFRKNISSEKVNTSEVDDNKIEVDTYWLNIFVWLIYENITDPFKLKKQVVKYGAPGTGKTYKAKQTAQLQFDIWKSSIGSSYKLSFEDCNETVQFHPSYSYEDFIEGLRPVLDSNGQSQLKLQNGIFKDLCKKAGLWEKDIFELNDELKNKKFQQLKIEDLYPFKEKLNGEHWEFIFELSDKTLKIEDVIPPYFILIDEINRAELSRVFGELMYSLEYRGTQGLIKTQYSQLNTEDTGMIAIGNSYKFFVPHNLYVIATMNTIDRSIDSFDFALRRRFKWEEVHPDTELLKAHLKKRNPDWIELADNVKTLNSKIENQVLLGKDYRIGHAYFWELPYNEKNSLSELRKIIWRESLKSLLSEYLRGSGMEDELLNTFKSSFGIR